jgi:sec-independent protein translocase protein TatA
MELVVILLVLVLLFGATRLADIGGSLGKGIREFKKNVKEDEEAEAEASAPPPSAPPVAVATPAPTMETATPEANGGETVAAVKCPSCGTLNPVGARHCNQCGTAIAAPAVS